MGEKRYIVGTTAAILEALPDIDITHARVTLDGSQIVVDAEIDEDKELELLEFGLEVLTHDQALALVNAPESAGTWYPIQSADPAPEKDPE